MEKATEHVKKIAGLVTSAYLIMILVISPFYAPEGYVDIGMHKFLIFKGASIVCMGALVPAAVFLFVRKWRESQVKLSVTDICVLLYGMSVMVSYACSTWKGTAFWGEDGWYMGLFSQLVFVAGYFAVSRFATHIQAWYVVSMVVSAAVFLLGLLNRFSIYPFDMEGANPGFISTLGNINWFCSYWVVLFPIGLTAYWNGFGNTKLKKAALIVYILLGFMTGIAQGSSSGFLALCAVCFMLFLLSFQSGEKLLRLFELLILFAVSTLLLSILINQFPEHFNYHNAIGDRLTTYAVGAGFFAAVVVVYAVLRYFVKQRKFKVSRLRVIRNAVAVFIILVVTGIGALFLYYSRNPGSVTGSSAAGVFVIDSDWGNGRGTTWYAGTEGFVTMSAAQKIVGVGPDCFYNYVYTKPQIAEKLYEEFGEARLTNAHNEWLTVLVNTGVCGLTAYAASFITAIYRYGKAGNRKAILMIGAVCLLSYTVHNMVSFQQVICTPLAFLIMGMCEKLCGDVRESD